MSFGFSVGDFITVIELANKIRTRFVDAPDQFKAISDEVKSLSNVLRDIDDILPQRDLASQQETELDEIAQGSRDVLKELEDTLDKYQELDPSTTGFGGRSRRVWKRLRWDQKDIDRFRRRITSNVLLFDTFLGRITNQIAFATKEGVDRLTSRQDDQYRQAILDWLTPIDYGTQHSDFIGRRQEGTGKWLLDSADFQSWLNESKQTLFCPGIPGAGKTIITSIVVEHLQNNFGNDAKIGIAYLYCNFRRQQEQKPADLLASLLKQLTQRRNSVPENVTDLYKRHNNERTRPSFNEISKVLHDVVADYSRTFIVIDALDECQVSDGGCRRLLAELFDLQAGKGVNFLATSRFIPEIEKEFEGRSIKSEIRASDDDLQRYLDGHMLRLPSFVLHDADLRNEVKTAIVNAVDGMFLLAQLHLDSLIGMRSPKATRKALEKLPQGSEAYNYAYEEAMERIDGQITNSRELAKQVLSWVTCAMRPLITSELQHALAVEIDESKLDKDNLPEIEDMVSVCAGLITVDEKSDIIRLVHYTTQEYFERTQKDWFPKTQDDITTTCVTYLSFDATTGFCPTDEEFEARLQLNPLFDYAARNWGHHARVAAIDVEQMVLDVLENEARMAGLSQAINASNSYPGDSDYSQRVPRQISGAHVAAYFGLRGAMIALLKNGHDLDSRNSYGQTPLSWAATYGQEVVVTLLLENGAELESTDTNGWTPLSWAAWKGHEAVVKLLLEKGAKLESTDTNGRTPLSWAAGNGHVAVAKLLLAQDGVDPDSKSKSGRTPLSWAAADGHETVVKLLLEKGAELDSKSKSGQTPLSWAAEYGQEAMVKLLLAQDGVDPDSKDEYGWTPLSRAAGNGHVAVAKLLLAQDCVDPDPKDRYGLTPLLLAAGNGHVAMVKLLLATDLVDPDSKDSFGRTPLSWAARRGNSNIVKLLLENYEKNGIVIREEDVNITPPPAADHRSRITCDILMEISMFVKNVLQAEAFVSTSLTS